MKKVLYISIFLISAFFTACNTTKVIEADTEVTVETVEAPLPPENPPVKKIENKDSITLLFAGDIMAHNVNYKISTYSKIYKDVKYLIDDSDLAFANIEAPIDTTKSASSYPNFNMTQKYVEAAVDAGFDVFSLCNNHTNDQGLDGIKETIKTTNNITQKYTENGNPVYFSGLKENTTDSYSYNIIETNGWKILFLPMTELLNRPDHSKYINYIKTTPEAREEFAKFVKKLREENPCDLYILSMHTSEPEYTRVIKKSQKDFYKSLLDAGVDVLWANHAHIIKDREFVYNSTTGSQKLIMYANGNTISGQRTKPDFAAKYPDYERDNTGDGLFYYVTYKKVDKKSPPKIIKAKQVYITTYINTADEYVIKPMTQSFVDYLYDVPRNNWAEYIKRRIIINEEKTKDLITWQ